VKAEFISEIGRQIAFLSAFLGGFAATRHHVPDRLLQSVGGDSCRHYRVKCSRVDEASDKEIRLSRGAWHEGRSRSHPSKVAKVKSERAKHPTIGCAAN
jgi:hypothetical protein